MDREQEIVRQNVITALQAVRMAAPTDGNPKVGPLNKLTEALMYRAVIPNFDELHEWWCEQNGFSF